jgi:hypothetical protein
MDGETGATSGKPGFSIFSPIRYKYNTVHAKAFAVYMQLKAVSGIRGFKTVAKRPHSKSPEFIYIQLSIFLA